MAKIIIQEHRVQGAWSSGSKSRCSVSRTERVLIIDEKKKKRPKVGAIFKKCWGITKKVMSAVLSIATLIRFVSFVKNLLI